MPQVKKVEAYKNVETNTYWFGGMDDEEDFDSGVELETPFSHILERVEELNTTNQLFAAILGKEVPVYEVEERKE